MSRRAGPVYLGFVILPLGLLLGGVGHPLTYAGGIRYSIVFPMWALLIGRHLTAGAITGV